MDSDDDEMRDASISSSSGGGGGDDGVFEEAAGEGMLVMEVRWFEVDLDYEFDAPRWFDLAQEEAPVEAAAAELWFADAPNYPPSPLIAMMMSEDLGLQNLRSIADIDVVHCSKSSQDYSGGAEQNMHRSLAPNEGWMPCYGASETKQKPSARTMVKGNFSKGSTLMKPTASQLARQNRQLEAKNAMRSKKSVGVRSERSTTNSNDCTHQAAKRQKLESGHLNKVTATKQPDLIHKIHEKNVMISSSDRTTGLPKLKITIPREPELATKLRAERSRILRAVPTNAKQVNNRDTQSASTTHMASARKGGTLGAPGHPPIPGESAIGPIGQSPTATGECVATPLDTKSTLRRIPVGPLQRDYQTLQILPINMLVVQQFKSSSVDVFPKRQIICKDLQSMILVVQPFRPTYHQHANVQYANDVSNMPVCTSNRASHLHKIDKKPEVCRDGLFRFRAQPLDKKILTSKGDIGVFQSAKRNATVPKEFNLSTSRKGKQAPLSELFNKLSLTAEARRAIDRQASERPNYITTKDCKENMIGSVWC